MLDKGLKTEALIGYDEGSAQEDTTEEELSWIQDILIGHGGG